MSRLDLLAKFGLDTSGWNKGINEVQGSTSKFQSMLGGMGTKIAGAFAVGVVANFAKNTITHAMDAADALGDMAALTGASTDALQALSRAATVTGSSMEPIEKALVSIKKASGEAINGNQALADTFLHFGQTIDDIKSKRPEEILAAIMAQVGSGAGNASEFARATDVLGKSTKDLDEVFSEIAANGGLDKWIQKLKESGKIIDEKTLQDLADLKQQAATMGADIDTQKTKMVGNLALGYRNIMPEKLGGFSQEERERRDPILSKNWEEWDKAKAAEREQAQELVKKEQLLKALNAEEQAQNEAKKKGVGVEAELNALLEQRKSLMQQYEEILTKNGEHNSQALQHQLDALKLMPAIQEAEKKLAKIKADEAEKAAKENETALS
jgi:hypothetical protein